MNKFNFSSLDNLSLHDIESEAEFIPLMTSEDEEALNKEALPQTVPILPLKNNVLFPGVVIPITAGRDKSIQLINLRHQNIPFAHWMYFNTTTEHRTFHNETLSYYSRQLLF